MEDRPWYAHWPSGLPVSLDYPSVPLHVFLQSAAKRYPDRPAIIFHIGEHTLTYAELWEKARRFAAALARLGVRKGEVVAVHLPNSPQFAIAYYGLLIIGAVFSPCFPLLSVKELLHQLLDSGARTMITLDMFMDSVNAVRHDTELRRVIVTGIQENLPPYAPVDVKPYGPRTYSFQQLLNETTGEPPTVRIDPERDLAHLAYTGGTTGRSKGVMLTHKAVVSNVLQFAHWMTSGRPVLGPDGLFEESADRVVPSDGWEYPIEPGKTVLVIVVPWSHAMGTVGYLNNPVYGGATMIVHPRFDAAAYAGDIVKYRANVFGGAPQLLQGIINLPDVESMDFSSVRYIASGAAPLPVEVLRRVEELVPDAVLMEAYGMTEMAMGVTANPCNRSGLRKHGSVGIPVFDTDVKIVDIDDPDIEIGFEEMGEVCVTGPQMMLGYWRSPEETAQVMRDGWVRTGDIGWMDKDGYIFISDRKKDMLIYNGFNVYPRELEEILRGHWAVADCAVIGKPDPEVGEFPKAFVVLKPGKTIEPKELMDFVAKRVAPYKKVREVEFINTIPVNYAGKPLKRELRRWEIERMQGAQDQEKKDEAEAGA
jgi:long-chain acyl-CoA synthetase